MCNFVAQRSNSYEMNNPKNALIIGNGFDLDLGLKTKFSHFANAEGFWPRKDGSPLSAFLYSRKSVEKWFDMEGALREYTLTPKGPFGDPNAIDEKQVVADFKYFEKVRKGLMDYLAKEVKKDILCDSTAAKVLKGVYDNSRFEYVYTLNYTDLNDFGRKLGLNNSGEIHYLHGSLVNKDIIIGIDDLKLRNVYKNWRKARSEYYKSHNIFADLDASKEIVFFGVSFGWIDYKYFKQFFAKVASPTVEPITENEKKYITIFTFDESDRLSILDFLERMDIDIDYLYSQAHFEIIRTKENQDEKKVESFLARLSKNKPSPMFTPAGC